LSSNAGKGKDMTEDLVQRLRDGEDSRTTRGAMIGEAADEIERLRAEVEALRADAERYRWLADRQRIRTIDDGRYYYATKEADDAAIDAAMKDKT
jgi:F0F1-type ATP synthase membrane subunit b/b'